MSLWEEYGTNNPYIILRKKGILIRRVHKKHPMLMDNNCMYYADLKLIYIRRDLSFKFKLFYLSHELGHLVLHYESCGDSLCCLGKMELEANYFAFRFMKIKFNRAELLHLTVEQLCSHLEVPYNAMKKIIHLIGFAAFFIVLHNPLCESTVKLFTTLSGNEIINTAIENFFDLIWNNETLDCILTFFSNIAS